MARTYRCSHGRFPCQPFSVAGKRKGAEDNRYLWTEMLRAIRQIQPTWVVGENVAGLLSMVQPGKTIKVGRTDDLFEENYIYRTEQQFTIDVICEDLENAEYSVQPIVIPACAVGAPHRRDRVWIIARRNVPTPSADTMHEGVLRRSRIDESKGKAQRIQERNEIQQSAKSDSVLRYAANSCNTGVESMRGRQTEILSAGVVTHTKGTGSARELFGKQEQIQSDRQNCRIDKSDFRCFPTQSPICNRDDGLPFRMADLTISFPKWRSKSIEALGNAWVPQVAFEIFKAVEENYKNNKSYEEDNV